MGGGGWGGGTHFATLNKRVSHGHVCDGTTIRACDPRPHNSCCFHLQRSLLMGYVFVTMLVYRKFFPSCAWRAYVVETLRKIYPQGAGTRPPCDFVHVLNALFQAVQRRSQFRLSSALGKADEEKTLVSSHLRRQIESSSMHLKRPSPYEGQCLLTPTLPVPPPLPNPDIRGTRPTDALGWSGPSRRPGDRTASPPLDARSPAPRTTGGRAGRAAHGS